MLELCKYAKENSDNFTKRLKCIITNSPCAFQKWCAVDSCMKMTPSYYKNGCSLKNVKEGIKMEEKTIEIKQETKPVEVEKKEKKKTITKTENVKKIIVKNVFVHNGRTYFNCSLGGVFITGEYPKMKAIEYKDSFCQDNIIKIIED